MATAPNTPYQKYLKTKVETASQPQLLVMLFDAAVKKLHAARKGLENKNIEEAHNNLVKVQRIFSELMVALDFDIGGELAKQLFAIYEFVYRRLVDANIQQDATVIDEVMPIIEQLREGWTAAVEKFEEAPEKYRAEAEAARSQSAAHKAADKIQEQDALQAAAQQAAALTQPPQTQPENARVADLPVHPASAGKKPALGGYPPNATSDVPVLRPPAATYGPRPTAPPPEPKKDEESRPRLNLQG